MSHHFIHNMATRVALNNLNTQLILNNTGRMLNRESITEDSEDISAEEKAPKRAPSWLIASVVGILETMAVVALVLIIVLFII